MKKIALLLILFCFVLGCEALPFVGPAVQAYVQWKDGEGHMYFKVDKTVAYNALKRTLVELNYQIIEDTVSRNGDYYILAKNKSKFKIKVTGTTDDISCVSIRVNIMGDKDYANLIYDRLSRQMNVVDFSTIK